MRGSKFRILKSINQLYGVELAGALPVVVDLYRGQVGCARVAPVVFDLYHLCMPSLAAADIPIGRFVEIPAAVARFCGGDPFNLLKLRFNAPKTPTPKTDSIYSHFFVLALLSVRL